MFEAWCELVNISRFGQEMEAVWFNASILVMGESGLGLSLFEEQMQTSDSLPWGGGGGWCSV